MTELEICEDKQKLMKTFLNYDDKCDDVLRNEIVGGKDDGKAPFESNTLLLQILLEIACRNVEDNALRRQALFLKMWSKLTDAKLTDDLKFHIDALFSVRNQAVAEFEKELMKEIKSDPSDCLNVSQKKPVRSSSIYAQKYQFEFEEISRIGKGGFGTVWKVRHKVDDICYAVKKVMFKYKKDSDFLKVIREVKSLASLNHLNVVGYKQAWLEYMPSYENCNADSFDSSDSSILEKLSTDEDSSKNNAFESMSDINQSFFSTDDSGSNEVNHFQKNFSDWNNCSEAPLLGIALFIQMEYCDFDLRFWMDERTKGNPLPFHLSTNEIFRDILSGVSHIHSKNVIHRDLKPQNIFFSVQNNSMKIGDFGLATLENELNDCVLNCGTVPYAAPELRKNFKYDSKVDMYSLGVILIELVTESKTRMELSLVLEQIFSGTISEELNHYQYVTLMKNLVSSDPTVRFSAEHVLSNLPVSTNDKTLEAEIKDLKERLQEKEARIQELEALLSKTLDLKKISSPLE